MRLAKAEVKYDCIKGIEVLKLTKINFQYQNIRCTKLSSGLISKYLIITSN